MGTRCGFANCNREITEKSPGAKVGYVIDGKQKEVHACTNCAFEILRAPRGTLKITRGPNLEYQL